MRDYIQLAQSAGSTATTARGALKWLRAHRNPLADLYRPGPRRRGPTVKDLQTREMCAREVAGALRSTTSRARVIGDFVVGIDAALALAQRGCTERNIRAAGILRAVIGTAHDRAPRYCSGGGVAKSYDYAFSSSHASTKYSNGYVYCFIARDHSRNGYQRATTLKIPRRLLDDVGFQGTLPGEACTITTGGVTRRYSVDGSFAGVLVALPEDLRREYGQWEHGRTVAECRAEIEIKRAAKAARAREIAQTERERARVDRRASLVARLCHWAIVTATDVRRVGACQAGISAWCAARGIDPGASLPLPALAADRTAARYALMIARGIRRGA